ncbi:MAG TPA: Gfo/Idh/MocA family oxidoreductase [Candidatus Hydrogenedentes bacterium]|nr:Gfo/Idh/MocA family oxidoreductase [Candidatus Hydrogenedentota bacterium]
MGKSNRVSRRVFLVSTAAAVAGCATGRRPRIRRVSPLEKLNVAGIGVGGMGKHDIGACASENVVALCDVDEKQAAESFKRFPKARRYRDFRVMLEKEKDIDAVTVSTPDHVHFIAAMTAMELGKHVYVQKPLAHSICEARTLAKAASTYKVATQMGNQGHSGDGVRRLCEMVWAGAIGPVREVHAWTNRPVWPQGIPEPLPAQPVPDTLDWNLWLGPAPERPYNPGYAPFAWRGWWDFGCGGLGDMGCHILDPANYALKLGPPSSVEVLHQVGNNDQTGPTSCTVRYEFPQRDDMPPVTLYWYEGQDKPPRPEGIPEDERLGEGDNGSYFVGDDGVITTGCYGGGTRLVPAKRMRDYTMPEPTIPRRSEHHQDWLEACKGIGPACSNFDYAGPFTETVLLGNLALRTGKRIEWDAEKMKAKSVPEAAQYVRRKYRRGWRA